MSEHPIEGLLGVSMEKIRDMVDVNAIIGDPITTPDGTVIIPVSKVSFGFGSGGSDFPNKGNKELFGGGSGAGVSIQPLAFLVVSAKNVQLVELSDGGSSSEKIFEAAPDVVGRFIDLFRKKKAEKEEADEL